MKPTKRKRPPEDSDSDFEEDVTPRIASLRLRVAPTDEIVQESDRGSSCDESTPAVREVIILDSSDEDDLLEDIQTMTVRPKSVKRATTRKNASAKKPKKVSAKTSQQQVRVGKEPAARKKSSGTVLENAFKKGKQFCSITCRLETVCPDLDLRQQIRDCVRQMKQIQMKSWHLVNLHTLRCLEEGNQLPLYDETFFDQYCSGVSSTSRSHNTANKNPALWETIKIYRAERSRTNLKEVENQVGLPKMKYELRQQMVANAGVMLREHFRRRLRAYVKVVYPNAKEKDVLHGCYNSEPTKLEEVQEMRALLTPDGFQRVIEDHIEANPGRSTKGVRAFSLFPVATSYTASHIKINATTLAGLCSRVKKKDPGTGGDCSITKWWGVDHIKIDHNAFAAEKWTVMRKAFDIDAFETLRPDTDVSKADFRHMTVEEKYAHASHLFANQVTTDGYGASVLLFRTKNELDEAEKQQSERLVPEGYRPEVVIGLDPGMRSVCTAVRERFAPRQIKRVRRRSVRKKRRRKRSWIRRYDGPKRKNGRDIVEVHAKEYRHLAGFRKRRAWEEVLKNSNPEPVKGLQQALAKRAKVVILDEFKTSKLCSTCHRELSPVSYLVDPDLDKRRKRAGKIISRYHSEERKLVECHAVLRCDQKKCEASYWNRDVNAAINIVNLLKYEIEHGGRMAAFARVQDRRD